MQKFISCPGFAILRICYNSSIFHLTFPSRWPIYITMPMMTITNTLASPFREEFRLGQDAHAIVPDSRAKSKLRRPVIVGKHVGRQGGGSPSVHPLLEIIGPIGPFQSLSIIHHQSRTPSSEGRLCLLRTSHRAGLFQSMPMPSRQPGGLRPGPRRAPAEAATMYEGQR